MSAPSEEISAWGPRPALSRCRAPVQNLGTHELEEQLASAPKSGQARMRSRQREYGAVLRGRFAKISAEIRRGVAEKDIFDLRGTEADNISIGSVEQLASSNFEPDELNPADFRYRDQPDQYERFMDWLETQHENGVLEVIDRDGNLYVRNATEDGVRWAQRQLKAAGYNPELATSAAFNQSIDARQLNLLYQRNFDLLTDITESVSKEISRELTDGFQRGVNPREMGQSITDRISSIGKTRATHLARYEVMNAHNVGALARYEDAGVTKVDVLTSNPCDDCKRIARGAPYKIDEARGKLPQHPSCVCTYSPMAGSISS